MPEWNAEIRRRLAALHLSPTREAEITEELSQHLEDRYRELVSRGLSAASAAQSALTELSGGELTSALVGIERPAPTPPAALGAPRTRSRGGQLVQDIRFGLRMLRTRPGFAAVVVLTLALGIGANTAIFSTVNAVLLRPLPYPESGNLVTFWGTSPEKRLPVVNYPDGMFVYFHQQTRVLEAVAAYNNGGASLSGDGQPELVPSAEVSADFFTVLRQAPVAGRVPVAEEGAEGKDHVVVVSHALWRRRFGGDRNLVGKSILVGGQPTVVIGIMPPGFDFPDRSEMWVPLVLDRERMNCWCLSTVGRLKPGQPWPTRTGKWWP